MIFFPTTCPICLKKFQQMTLNAVDIFKFCERHKENQIEQINDNRNTALPRVTVYFNNSFIDFIKITNVSTQIYFLSRLDMTRFPVVKTKKQFNDLVQSCLNSSLFQ